LNAFKSKEKKTKELQRHVELEFAISFGLILSLNQNLLTNISVKAYHILSERSKNMIAFNNLKMQMAQWDRAVFLNRQDSSPVPGLEGLRTGT
jgi:hypothetical protein